MNDASITTMKDPEGNVLYPKTRTDAVYDSSGNRLDQTISDMDSDISSLQSDLGSKSSASAVTGNDAFSKISTLNSDLTAKADFRYLTCSRISRNNLSAIESDLLSVFNSMTDEGAIAFVSIYANYSGSFTNGGRAPAICYKATSSLFGVYVFVGTDIKQGVYNGSTWSWN